MSEVRTERLVRALARDLVPVRRIPRLRTVAGGAGLLALAMAAWALGTHGMRENLSGLLADSPGFVSILLGLALATAGGAAAALGASVPGREAVERAGFGLLATALLLALVLGPLALFATAGAGVSPPPAGDLDCLLGAAAIAVAPGLALLWFVRRAAARRPILAVGLGVAGVVALGALIMQLSCPFAGARHLIVAHALAPLLYALALALPLSWILRPRAPAG